MVVRLIFLFQTISTNMTQSDSIFGDPIYSDRQW